MEVVIAWKMTEKIEKFQSAYSNFTKANTAI